MSNTKARVIKINVDTDTKRVYYASRKGVVHLSVKLNAKFVKQMLIERDLDQKGLAERSGLSEITISRALNGKAFNSDTLAKIATALGCHPVDLIDATGYGSPHVVAPTIATIRAY